MPLNGTRFDLGVNLLIHMQTDPGGKVTRWSRVTDQDFSEKNSHAGDACGAQPLENRECGVSDPEESRMRRLWIRAQFRPWKPESVMHVRHTHDPAMARI